MGTNKKSSWKEARTAERNRQLVMLAIPIVLILLIIIIVVADRRGKDETGPVQTERATATPSEAASANPDETSGSPGETMEATAATQESVTEEPVPETADLLQRDTVPEINTLMESYYKARVDCDVEKLNGLYGKTETDVAKLEAAKAQLFLYARHVAEVDEIVCYSAELEGQDIWFVLMTARIHFRSTDTKVPVGMELFVRKDEDGNFLLIGAEDVTDEMESFKKEIVKLDEAILLTRDINTKMRDAIDSDPVLAEIYGTLNSGSPLWETGEEETEPNIEISTE